MPKENKTGYVWLRNGVLYDNKTNSEIKHKRGNDVTEDEFQLIEGQEKKLVKGRVIKALKLKKESEKEKEEQKKNAEQIRKRILAARGISTESKGGKK